MKKESTHNILYYSFIISIFLHITFFAIGSILDKPKKEPQFQKITMVSSFQEIEERKIEKKEITKIKEKSKGEIVQKIFSPFENDKEQPKYKTAQAASKSGGGGAEILTSTSQDSSLNTPSGNNFIVQNVPKGEGEGIGLGGKGKGIGVSGDKEGIGIPEENYNPPKIVSEEDYNSPKIDKSKILKEYLTKIIEKIEKNKKYPESAREENIEGKTEIKITILKTGELKEVKILSSSGYKILDNAAISTIKSIFPFTPIPAEAEKESISVKLKIVFRLEDKY